MSPHCCRSVGKVWHRSIIFVGARKASRIRKKGGGKAADKKGKGTYCGGAAWEKKDEISVVPILIQFRSCFEREDLDGRINI